MQLLVNPLRYWLSSSTKQSWTSFCFSNIDRIRQEAVWNDETQRWRIPDLILERTKLPPAGKEHLSDIRSSKIDAQWGKWGTDELTPRLLTMPTHLGPLGGSTNNMSCSSPMLGGRKAGRSSSKTAPARLEASEEDLQDNALFQVQLTTGLEHTLSRACPQTTIFSAHK